MQVISKKRNKKADGKIPGSDPQTKIKQKRKISVSVTPEIELNSINHRYCTGACVAATHTVPQVTELRESTYVKISKKSLNNHTTH